MHAEKSAQHCYGVVAPQSAVTPNDILWHPNNPAWYAGISRINELPPPPNFFSARWSVLIGIIVAIAAETVFMAIVTFTGIKDLVSHVFLDIGFERPVLIGSQIRRRRGLTEWNDVIID